MKELTHQAKAHLEPAMTNESWWLSVDMNQNRVEELPSYDLTHPTDLARQLVAQFQFTTDEARNEAELFLASKLRDIDFSFYGESSEKLRDFIYEMF